MVLRADDVDLGRDRDLVERYQAGDPYAFDDLYRRYFGRLHRFCQRHAQDSHEAEEIAQEAFVKAFGSMHMLQGERRFYPWMTVIAKRISIDRHRKLSRIELTDEPDVGSVEPDLDHLFDEIDIGHLRDAMGRLGPRHREVLVLREERGMSYADIAGHLDVPVTTVEALLHRARKALRREYTAVGGERRGLWGLPLLGWLATRGGRMRAALSEKWAEAAAIAAPVAVGAVTAAVVLGPGASAPVDVEAGESTTAHAPSAEIDPAGPAAAPSDPVEAVPSASSSGDGAGGNGSPGDAAPEVEAGPVDVFIGPEGTDRARDEAEQMPLSGQPGPATAGVDPPTAVDDASDFVAGAVGALLTPGPQTDSHDRSAPDGILGGSR